MDDNNDISDPFNLGADDISVRIFDLAFNEALRSKTVTLDLWHGLVIVPDRLVNYRQWDSQGWSEPSMLMIKTGANRCAHLFPLGRGFTPQRQRDLSAVMLGRYELDRDRSET